MPLFAENIMSLQFKGIEVTHTDNNEIVGKFTLERELDPICLSIPINNETIWEGNYASRDVPERCKATVVKTVGQIRPLIIHPEVATFGELEVLEFVEKMQKDKNLLLIDSRKQDLYEYRTIPSAYSMPYPYITKAHLFPKEFKESLAKLGVRKIKGVYDFTKAKTIVLFCNGSWCGQSPSMIKSLIYLGYPATKIKWYRGGMNDWLVLSMTSTHP